MLNFLNEDTRKIAKLKHKIKPILALEDKYRSMSDEELKAMTPLLKQKLADGASLNDIYVEAFATAREASRRVLGLFPYPVQLIGGLVINDGDVAEMQTGEGKTLTAVMPVYLNALAGQGVHVVTVNEYLSQRDAELMGQIYEFLGLSVGVNRNGISPQEKKVAYACDITYTTNSELGFDYLRDNMVLDAGMRVLRGLNFALIDEADSILIDESRTPLIISGGEKGLAAMYLVADRFAKSLKKGDYEIDVRSKTVQLTDSGVSRAEASFKLDNLYDIENTKLLHYITQALKANFIMIRDVDYVVDTENDEIMIVDPNTGRLMKGRQWSDGLHQAVEAKEGVSIKQETMTLATITYQNFFRMYNKLAGMTGTAKTDEEEFLEIYNMKVVCVPTNRPVQREDLPDVIYGTKKAKFEGLVQEVKRRHATGQPVLVGTIAVETSELISELLTNNGIGHNVLNAKNHMQEAAIIARAGQKGAVTIATNMAGRGTDIKLGEGVKELGGLCVLGSERHESRRIDNQLRGRSGRQGDPGVSQFFVSVEDDLMQRFGSERMESMFKSLGDECVTSKGLAKSIKSAQKRVEGVNYDARKNLMQYDDVMRTQREIIYRQRDYILDHTDIHDNIHKMFISVITSIVERCMDPQGTINYSDFVEGLKAIDFKDLVTIEEINGMTKDELIAHCADKAWNMYNEKIEPVEYKAKLVEKVVALQTIDRLWADHIDQMSKLKTGIGLRGYAQANPVQAYTMEGYQMFERMMDVIAFEVVSFCMRLKVEESED